MLVESQHINIHYTEIGGNHQGATEEEASDISHLFKPQEIADAYTEVIATADKASLDLDPSKYPGAVDITVWKNVPDMYRIKGILDLPYEAILVDRFPDRFQDILQLDPKHQSRLSRISTALFKMASMRLQETLLWAFAPQSVRNANSLLGDLSFRGLEQRIPDLSSLSTASDRLDKVIEMLTMTYEGSLAKLKIDPQYNNLSPEARVIAQQQQVDYVLRNTFYGLLVDGQNGGTNSAFKYNEMIHGTSKSTRLGKCPFTPYVQAYLPGAGLALVQNRDKIMELIA